MKIYVAYIPDGDDTALWGAYKSVLAAMCGVQKLYEELLGEQEDEVYDGVPLWDTDGMTEEEAISYLTPSFVVVLGNYLFIDETELEDGQNI